MTTLLRHFSKLKCRLTSPHSIFQRCFQHHSHPSPLLNPSTVSDGFLKQIPKADLHIHLDGSVRLSTLLEYAQDKHSPIQFPALPISSKLPQAEWNEEILRKEVFREEAKNLVDLLRGFAYTCALLQRPDVLERVAYEFVEDCIKEGVYYAEIRFAPQLLANEKQSIRQVLKAINKGLEKGRHDANLRAVSLSPGNRPPHFNYGIIGCAMRYFDATSSKWFESLDNLIPNTSFTSKARIAAITLVNELIASRDIDGVPVVAIDIAGAENGYPPRDFVEAFRLAHKNFFHATVHAGEDYGPESIYQAVTDLYATRIGHGYHLLHADRIIDPKVKDKNRYVLELEKFIGETRTTLEVCLTSNLQTLPVLKGDIKQHSLKDFLRDGLSVALCTDNTLVCCTTLSKEYKLALQCYPMDHHDLKALVLNGFDNSFWSGDYQSKRRYLQHVLHYYDQVAREHTKFL